MNRPEVLTVIAIMANAWPYPEWDDSRIELWVAAIGDIDAEPAHAAAVQAVRELDRCPSVAWVRAAARGHDSREQFGLPESSEVPATREASLAGIAAARAALSPPSPAPQGGNPV